MRHRLKDRLASDVCEKGDMLTYILISLDLADRFENKMGSWHAQISVTASLQTFGLVARTEVERSAS